MVRAHDFLVEVDERFIVKRYKPMIDKKITEDGLTITTENLIRRFMSYDPTTRKNYSLWMIIRYIKGDISFNDMKKTTQYLRMFNLPKVKNQIGEFKDINKITSLEQLKSLVTNFNSRGFKIASKEEIAELVKTKQARLIYNGPDYLIIIPKTLEASCILGMNTKWCTANPNEEDEDLKFDTYTQDGNELIIILDKKTKHRYQFSMADYEYKDEDELEVIPYLFAEEHPKLINILDKKGLLTTAISKVYFKVDTSEDMQIQAVIDLPHHAIEDMENNNIKVHMNAILIADKLTNSGPFYLLNDLETNEAINDNSIYYMISKYGDEALKVLQDHNITPSERVMNALKDKK